MVLLDFMQIAIMIGILDGNYYVFMDRDKVFKKESPKNTWFISPSEFCTHWFNHYYDKYNEYRVFSLPHASELDENKKRLSNIDINRNFLRLF